MAKFIWIDMEMSGLYPATSQILEIAYIITDTELNILQEFEPITISHDLDNIKWPFIPGTEEMCLSSFEKSGLLDRIRQSTTTVEQASKTLLADIKLHCKEKEGYFAGNSVWRDVSFIEQYMPQVQKYCNRRNLDVTAFKLARVYWYPEIQEFPKAETHDALTDIKESIEQMRYLREKILK